MTCKHLLNGAPDCVFCHRDQLKQELSLAEEGLANYAQENERLRQVILAARRNGSVPEAYWLQEPQSGLPSESVK